MAKRISLLRCALLALACVSAQAQTGSGAPCGELIRVATHGGTATAYSFAGPSPLAPVTLLLLIGGGGVMNLDDQGCARSQSRNVLIRMRTLWHHSGLNTALVDAPSDVGGMDGLAGLRVSNQHANDLGQVIADVRRRTSGTVWLIGHSRGTLSAANAAIALSSTSVPDGVILLSAMMSAEPRGKKYWVSQTVSELALGDLKIPLLMVGHVADNCPRSLATLMALVMAKAGSTRAQEVQLDGGLIPAGRAIALSACEVGEPHDFVGQDAELAAGIARFVGGVRF